MRITLTLFAFFVFIACNNSSKTKQNTNDTLLPQTIVAPVTSNSNDTVFTGLGTEPFWSVYVINNTKIVFHPADGSDIEVPFAPATTTNNITTKYNSANDSVTMELTIIKQDCSDGMSDNVHPYSVSLSINAIKYNGCGTMK